MRKRDLRQEKKEPQTAKSHTCQQSRRSLMGRMVRLECTTMVLMRTLPYEGESSQGVSTNTCCDWDALSALGVAASVQASAQIKINKNTMLRTV